MKWITRERSAVDRIACPWLIKRFMDAEAEFLYVPAADVMTIAAKEQATPFDVPGAAFGHHGSECSFDALMRHYGLTDPALVRLATIVRGADTDALHQVTGGRPAEGSCLLSAVEATRNLPGGWPAPRALRAAPSPDAFDGAQATGLRRTRFHRSVPCTPTASAP